MLPNCFIEHQNFFRLFFFFLSLLMLMFLEFRFPRRPLMISRHIRWVHNLLLVIFNTLCLRLVLPLLAIGAAIIAQEKSWGLFNLFSGFYWVKVFISVIFLDFVIYWQHRFFHRWSLFWCIHRMHHTDLDIDVTTGLRFHPIEIILSMLIKIVAVMVFGIPVLGVLIFEILLNVTSMFNHANVFIPLSIDRYLRYFVVTPDMHRVHHSVLPRETNSNYGFNLSVWDRLFASYQGQPEAGHLQMKIGLNVFRAQKYLRLWWLLLIPFVKDRSISIQP